MFHFDWIWMFLLFPLPWIISLTLPGDESATKALRVPYFKRWTALQQNVRTVYHSKRRSSVLLYFCWAFFLTAAAKPMWIGDPVNLPTTGRDLMMAIDLSGSMEYPDFLLNGEKVDRLTIVKNVAGDFIERRQGDRIGLILFGRKAYVQTPLTFDRETVKFMLNESEIGLAGKETAIGDGIGLAVKRLKDRPENSRVLILLTDGANTAGEIEPLKAAELAKELGLKIYTIGVGADAMDVQTFFGTRRINPSADLDEGTLTKIAAMTGGAYFRAKDTKALEQIYVKLDELEPATQEAETMRPEKSLFYWPLICAVVLGFVYSLINTRIISASRFRAS